MPRGKQLIGYGAAQVFDTSKSVNAYERALAMEDKKAKESEAKFLGSLGVDSKGVRQSDIPGFTSKYNEFLQWSSQNQKELRDPSNNPVVWAEFQKKKNSLLQDVALSKQAAQIHKGGTDTVYKGRKEFFSQGNIDKLNTLHSTSIYDDGFDQAMSFKLGRDYTGSLNALKGTKYVDKHSYEDESGVTRERYTIKEDAVENDVDAFYRTYQEDLLDDHGDEDSAKNYVRQYIESILPAGTKVAREGDGGFTMNFGSGRYGQIGFQKGELNPDTYFKGPSSKLVSGQEVMFSMGRGKENPTINLPLAGGVAQSITPQSIVKLDDGKDYLGYIVRPESMDKDQKEAMLRIIESEALTMFPEDSDAQLEYIDKKHNEMSTKKDVYMLSPLTDEYKSKIDAAYGGFITKLLANTKYWGEAPAAETAWDPNSYKK